MFFGLLAVAPLFAGPYWVGLGITAGILVIALQGLNILVGYAGQLSIGHAAFMAVGAFTSVNLAVQLNFPFLLALVGGGIAAALVSALFGAFALRIKGLHLLIVTLAAHFIITFTLARMDFIGGFLGQPAPLPSVLGVQIRPGTSFFYLMVILMVTVGRFAWMLPRTNTGRAFITVRDHDIAARMLGVNVTYYKLLAFAISGFYAGMAGSLFSFYIGIAHVEQFRLEQAIWYLGMLIVGGLGSTMGPVFGALFFTLLQEISLSIGPALETALPGVVGLELAANLAFIVWGVVIIGFLLFEPRGINHAWEVFKASYRLHPFSRVY